MELYRTIKSKLRKYNLLPEKKIFCRQAYEPIDVQNKIDLSQGLIVRNQYNQNACTGYATSAMRYFYLQNKKLLSPLFAYYLGRQTEHTESSDNGARLSDVVDVLYTHGICEEIYHPDIPDTNKDIFQAPLSAAYLNAAQYRVKNIAPLVTLNQLILHLSKENVAALGFMVYDSFESPYTTKTGIVTTPSQGENLLGGHAVCACGYDMEKKQIKFLNSYGLEWGDKGYGYLPFDFFPNYIISIFGVETE